MRRQRLEIDRIPLDCWCRVIEYFEEVNDFLSVIYTIKNLLNHIKVIYPYCTKNILFSLYGDHLSIPHDVKLENQAHVITLSVYFSKNKFINVVENILERISNIYRNLRSLKFVSPILEFQSLKLSSLKKDYIFQNLRNMSIHTTVSPLSSRTSRTKVNTKQLVSVDLGKLSPLLEKISLKLSVGGRTPFNEHLRVSDTLSLSSSKKNNIKSVYLEGWSLKNKIIDLFENLEELYLNDCSLEDTVIRNKKKLSVLCLRGRSLYAFEEINSLDNLRFLSLSSKGSRGYISFSIEDFPSLEVLEIGKCRFWENSNEKEFRKTILTNNEVMCLSNLPSLRELIMEDVSFPVSLSSLEKLEVFSISGCNSVEVSESVVEYPSLKKIQKFLFSNTYLGDSLFNIILLSLLSFDIKDKLEEFSWDITSSSTDQIHFSDFPSLTKVSSNKTLVGGFINCPNLREINIGASEHLKVRNLPQLKEILVNFDFNPSSSVNFVKQISHNYFPVLDRIVLYKISNEIHKISSNLHISSSFLSKCKELSVSSNFSTLMIDGGDNFSKEFQNLFILGHGKKIVLKNLSCKLIFGGKRFCDEMELTNLVNIRSLRLFMNVSLSRLCNVRGIGSFLGLNNLSNCRCLIVNDCISFYRKISIKNTPIRKLVFRFIYVISDSLTCLIGARHSFSIDDDNFPLLEELVIYDDHLYSDDRPDRLTKLQLSSKMGPGLPMS